MRDYRVYAASPSIGAVEIKGTEVNYTTPNPNGDQNLIVMRGDQIVGVFPHYLGWIDVTPEERWAAPTTS